MQWQDYLLRYGSHSAQLRGEVAALARHLATNIVEWSHIRALISSRLITLDKCPGVRPIAIGEELRRIVCKALAFATGSDVAELCGVSQLCSGLEAGIKGLFMTSESFLKTIGVAVGVSYLCVDAKMPSIP